MDITLDELRGLHRLYIDLDKRRLDLMNSEKNDDETKEKICVICGKLEGMELVFDRLGIDFKELFGE